MSESKLWAKIKAALQPRVTGRDEINLAATHQPPPKPGREDVGPMVLADIQARIDMGIEKHGVPLQTHNGRDPLWDAYQEAIDLCMYLRQAIMERDGECNGGQSALCPGCKVTVGGEGVKWQCKA